jgi:hypothetical protein
VHVVKCCGKKSCSKFATRVKNGSTTSLTKFDLGVKTLGTQMSKKNPVTTFMEADNENTLEITSPSSEVGYIFQFTFTGH